MKNVGFIDCRFKCILETVIINRTSFFAESQLFDFKDLLKIFYRCIFIYIMFHISGADYTFCFYDDIFICIYVIKIKDN